MLVAALCRFISGNNLNTICCTLGLLEEIEVGLYHAGKGTTRWVVGTPDRWVLSSTKQGCKTASRVGKMSKEAVFLAKQSSCHT